MNDPLPAVFVGLDVGKSDHHAVALTADGKTVLDKALPNDEAKLRAILEDLAVRGLVLMVVDQPATIGALPVAVAQRMPGVEVAYLPGLAMRRIADLHPGSAKTDLLTELTTGSSRESARGPWSVARLAARDGQRGWAAGSVPAGGAAARVA